MDIRALHHQGLTYAEIGRIVGRDWRTVKRYLTTGAQPVYRRRRAPSVLDPHKPRIDQWLAKCPALEATRIHQDLVRDWGFEGSYPTVRRYVERARPRIDPEAASEAAEERFETAPGHQAQVDCSHEQPIRTPEGLELPLYGFKLRLCRAYRPQTKGKVESDVPYVRGRLLRMHGFASYEQANAEWAAWNDEIARRRVHGTHGEIVAVRAERDRGALLALPADPYLVVERTTRKVARDGLFSFEGRRYAVPGAIGGETVELRPGGIAEGPDELVERAEAAELGYREFLDLLLESEVWVLEGRRYASRLKMAGLPHHKTLEDFDASFQPELDPKRIAELRSLRFIERKVSCLILGPPGTGKSHLSVGLAMEALASGYLVRYTSLDDLIRGLRAADALGKLHNRLAQLQRPQLLIIDEAGYLPLERADANRLFQVVNRRYERGSTIVTSNKAVGEWAESFGDEVLAAAILDRLLHDAEVLTINGPSYRLRGQLAELQADAAQTEEGDE